MRGFSGRVGAALRGLFEQSWHYTGSLAAVCLFAAVLGLGIYHSVVHDGEQPELRCFAGVVNPAGAEPPRGVIPLGQGSLPGVPHVQLEYGANQRLTRMRYLSARGGLSPLPGSRVAEQVLHYDEHGRLLNRRNYDAAGAPAEDAQGVAVREFDYDAAGRLVRTRFRDAEGRLTVPRFPGYAERRLSYDAQGRPIRVEYLDASGHPVLNAAGEQTVLYSYGEDGSVVRENRVGDMPADNHSGVARKIMQPESGGFRLSWQDSAGRPVVNHATGAVAVQRNEHAAQGVHRSSYLAADGQPIAHQRTCAEHLKRCNKEGNLEWECFSGADGLPVNHPVLGYAEHVCEYSPVGELRREFFWDAAGNPASLHERRFAGDFGLTLHRDGSTAVQPLR